MTETETTHRLHRLHAVASGINGAIVRMAQESTLYEEACRIAVEQGGMLMAWVGIVDPSSGILEVAARWGKDEGYLDSILVHTSPDQPEGLGPGGEAFRTGRPAVCNDIEHDHQLFASRAQALARGYRSCAGFPLVLDRQPVGVFLVYSGQALNFDQQEIALLAPLAENFSFAIEARRNDEQRRQAEAALRASEARLRVAGRLAHIGAWEVELPSRVVTWSEEMRLVHDLPPGTTPSLEECLAFFAPPQRKAIETAMADCAREGTPFDMELELTTQGGRLMHLRCIGEAARDGSGVIRRIQGALQDITDRKLAKAEILRLNAGLERRVQERTAQLEEANRELGAFSYSVAHDLRSPLAAISGFGHVLERHLGDLADDKARHYIDRMQSGVGQMQEMIDALLSLSQLTRAQLRWEPVDLAAMARLAYDNRRQHEPTRQAQLRIEGDLAAYGDPRLLQLVADNLMGNAWKFTGQQALADITVGSESDAAGQKVYFVRDNGVGFDMQYAAKLFGAFQRLHAQRDFPGTGIGLATVWRIITKHGGRIWAESAPGQGATFRFTLGEQAA